MEHLHQAANRAIAGCLSSSPIPFLLSETLLPPIRVTLTDFALSSHEWALRLPTFFPILGLARLGVKPRLCRSSWRGFASTQPLLLLFISLREALLAYPFPLPRNLPSFTAESTFSSPCSRTDSPLSRQGVAFAHLDSSLPYHLVLWTDGSASFSFGKSALAYLPTALSMELRPHFFIQQAHYAQVFPLKSAPF